MSSAELTAVRMVEPKAVHLAEKLAACWDYLMAVLTAASRVDCLVYDLADSKVVHLAIQKVVSTVAEMVVLLAIDLVERWVV